jgi:hypothetical protein
MIHLICINTHTTWARNSILTEMNLCLTTEILEGKNATTIVVYPGTTYDNGNVNNTYTYYRSGYNIVQQKKMYPDTTANKYPDLT